MSSKTKDTWKENFRQWRDENYEYVIEGDQVQTDEAIGTALAIGAGALAARKIAKKLSDPKKEAAKLRKKQLKKQRKVDKKYEKKVHKQEMRQAKKDLKKKNKAEIKAIKKGSQDVKREHVDPMDAYISSLGK